MIGLQPHAQINRRKIELEVVPRFRPGGDRGVFHFRRVFENADAAGEGEAGRVNWPPDGGQKFILIETGHGAKTLTR